MEALRVRAVQVLLMTLGCRQSPWLSLNTRLPSPCVNSFCPPSFPRRSLSHLTVTTMRPRTGLRGLSQSRSWSVTEPGLDSAPGPRVGPAPSWRWERRTGRRNQWAEITGTSSVHPRACCPRLDIPLQSPAAEGRTRTGSGEEDPVGEVREAGSVGSPGKQVLSWSQEFTEAEARERLRGTALDCDAGPCKPGPIQQRPRWPPKAQRGAETPGPGALLAQPQAEAAHPTA